jgi:hypothetical protein
VSPQPEGIRVVQFEVHPPLMVTLASGGLLE